MLLKMNMSVTEKWNNSILKQYVPFKKDTTDFLGRKEMMNAYLKRHAMQHSSCMDIIKIFF